jgi:hypothetical protein
MIARGVRRHPRRRIGGPRATVARGRRAMAVASAAR